ncbi:hypothetical protein [Streptodolium elevatio]
MGPKPSHGSSAPDILLIRGRAELAYDDGIPADLGEADRLRGDATDRGRGAGPEREERRRGSRA